MDLTFVSHFPKTLGCVVDYNGKKYVLWHINSSGKAQLINPDGIKFSGTPEVAKLQWLYQLPLVHHNGHDYVVDKHGRIFSLSTGKICFPSGHINIELFSEAQNSEIYDINCDYKHGLLTFQEYYNLIVAAVKEHIQEYHESDCPIVYC